MCQAGCTYDGSYLFYERILQVWLLLDDTSGYVVTYRHAHTSHFQTVGEAVVYEDAARQREHLRLVLQSAECRREDETVVIALEFRAVIMALSMLVLLSETLV